MRGASIVVATYNRGTILGRVLEAMLDQDYEGDYEVIVVDDGSTDDTVEVAKRYPVRFFSQKHRGPAAARNLAIKKARHSVVVVMDDDCIPEKGWLRALMRGFDEKVGIVSSFSIYGGTSTAYLKKAVEQAGYFDENFPFEYREDTDLVFRIQDLGYEIRLVSDAGFAHVHSAPRGLMGKARYALRRVWVHHIDPFLYKKHPSRTREFLDIRYGFLRNPLKDFQVATGTWKGGGEMSLSSPQGLVLIENRTPIHGLLIVLGGVFYVLCVKLARLYGSIKYGKLLI